MTDSPSIAQHSASQSPVQQAKTEPVTQPVIDPEHSVKVKVPEVFIYYQMSDQDVLN